MMYSSRKLFSLLFSLSLTAFLLFSPSQSVPIRSPAVRSALTLIHHNNHKNNNDESSSSSHSFRALSSTDDRMRVFAEKNKATDPACQGVECGNGKCVDGQCICSGGFGGANCDISPSVIITNITLPSKIGSTATVRWQFTGSFSDVSVFLFPNDPTKIFGSQVFPTYIRRDAPNTGSFSWNISTAVSGQVKVGVAYSTIASFFSVNPLFIEDPCNSFIDCGANGRCFQGECRCRPGFIGRRCEINQCPPDQCNLRGTCDQGVCTCNQGFKGTRCEIDTRTCKGSCDNGGIMDPTCTRCTCAGAWGNAGCRTCLLRCPANTQPDASCTSCICTPGWAGIQCDVPFATVQFKLENINVDSVILPPTAPSELRPLAEASLKALKQSLAQDLAYALTIPPDRVNITNVQIDTSVNPSTVLIVTAQLLAVPDAPASDVTIMVDSLKTQVANQTAFQDSRLGLGQMSSRIDLKFKIDYMRDQSADGGLLVDIQSTAFRFWIFILAGGGAIILVIASISYYRYRKKRRMNLTKTVNQLNEVSLGTGNDAPVQRSGAKGYEMPTANAAFPTNNNNNNNNNNTGTTQQFSAKAINTSATSNGLSSTKSFGVGGRGFPAAGTVGGRNREWTIFYTDGGDPYWYNNQNGVSLWEAPSDF